MRQSHGDAPPGGRSRPSACGATGSHHILIITFFSVCISSRTRPAPSAPQVSGSSGVEIGSRVACRSTKWRLLSSAPPPVSTIPLSTMSPASSAAVCSSATLTASMIEPTGRALGNLPPADHDFLWHAVYQVAPPDLHHAALTVLRHIGGTDLFLDPLGAALTDEEVMVAADIGNDRLVHLVAPDANRSAIEDAPNA